jgi:hypothetical protein
MDAMVRDVSFASGSARVLLAALRSEEGKAGRFAYSATAPQSIPLVLGESSIPLVVEPIPDPTSKETG